MNRSFTTKGILRDLVGENINLPCLAALLGSVNCWNNLSSQPWVEYTNMLSACALLGGNLEIISIINQNRGGLFSGNLMQDKPAWRTAFIGVGMHKDVAEWVKNYGKLFESVSQQAFLWCENLKIVNIPEGVTSIEEYAFLGCVNLTSIDLSQYFNLQSIGDGAFKYCKNLSSIDLSQCFNLQSVGRGAFLGCGKLERIILPSSVTSIGDGAFYGCESLKTITMLEEVEKEIMGALGKYGLSDTWGESDPDGNGIVTLTKQQ